MSRRENRFPAFRSWNVCVAQTSVAPDIEIIYHNKYTGLARMNPEFVSKVVYQSNTILRECDENVVTLSGMISIDLFQI